MLATNCKLAIRKINNLTKELQEKGILGPFSNGLLKEFSKFPVYAGFDPTSPDIHLGHLFVLGALNKFKENGCPIYLIVGDTTSKIGDPSFRTSERTNLTYSEKFRINLNDIFSKISGSSFGFKIFSNSEWHNNISFVEFLSTYGKHFKVKELLNKDCMKSRFENGLNFSELSYPLLQSYDFLHLYRSFGCKLQVGGSDQWGNISTGLRFINSLHGEDTCFGLTTGILTDPLEQKMSKSSNNALWLTGNEKSPILVYQYMINPKFLNVFNSFYGCNSNNLSGAEIITNSLFGEDTTNICKTIIENPEFNIPERELEKVFSNSKIIQLNRERPLKIIDLVNHVMPNLSKGFLRDEIMKGKILIDGKRPENPLVLTSKLDLKSNSLVTHDKLIRGVLISK
jgi:tyrosyl-tRNA synthetase